MYVYDFTAMTQTNIDSGRTRKVRRTESAADADEMGFVSTLKLVAEAVTSDATHSATVVTKLYDGEPAVAKKPRFELPGLACIATPPPPPAVTSWHIPSSSARMPVAVAATPTPAPTPAPTSTSTTAPSPAPSSPSTPAAKAAPESTAVAPPVDSGVIAAQAALGPQSRRHQPYDLGPVAKDPHGKHCFDEMLKREKQLCGEFAVFYHSYSFAALLYEVQAAVAAVLFRFKSEYASLPRLLKKPYDELPDADALIALFPKMPTRDHDPRFRAVAISATSSILAGDSEAPPKNIFLSGYSCTDLSFVGVLEGLLVSCGVPASLKTTLGQKIIEMCATYGLDASQFKGKPCKSGRAGHMLQLFVKRSIVDKYVYAAHPFGVVDKKRPVLSKYLEGKGPIQGQVRIVTNPSAFMRGNAVRMYVYSADETFHAKRGDFQKALTSLLTPIIGAREVRLKAAEGIYGGKVPPWFNPDDKECVEKLNSATDGGKP